MTNLLADIPEHLPAELQQVLLRAGGARVERIVSRGHVSPEGFWYDQDEGEWVVLLAGAARLAIEDPEGLRTVDLRPGDWLDLPAHTRHRVDWTDPTAATIWLAVFYRT